MPSQVLVIMNPTSGGSRYQDAIRRLAADRPWLRLHVCDGPEDGMAAARGAADEGYTAVVAAGGDGTIHGVVNGLVRGRARIPLGILPAGTANDLARTLGVPEDPEAALSLIQTGSAMPMDLIRVRNRRHHYLINAATGGFSSAVNDHLDSTTKQRWSSLAYLRAAIEALGDARMYETSLLIDGREVNVEAAAILLANGQYAGGMQLVPAARPDDHLLDLAIVTARTTAQRTRLLAAFAIGQHLHAQGIRFERAREVEVRSRPAMSFNSDGETIGRTPLSFELVPAAIRVIRPNRSKEAGHGQG